MSKTFNTISKISQVKEPLFQLSRVKYRSPRSSELENLETNLIKLDLTRIFQELENIDTKVLNNIIFFIGQEQDKTDEDYLNDGLSYVLDGVGLQLNSELIDENSQSPSIEKLSGIMLRLFNKVQRLEMEK